MYTVFQRSAGLADSINCAWLGLLASWCLGEAMPGTGSIRHSRNDDSTTDTIEYSRSIIKLGFFWVRATRVTRVLGTALTI